MKKLEDWMKAQIAQHRVEPNSVLGEAITYMRKHWDELTLFLRVPGAPLDNNACERVLKKAILHRKNARFYKTRNGARVGCNGLLGQRLAGRPEAELLASTAVMKPNSSCLR